MNNRSVLTCCLVFLCTVTCNVAIAQIESMQADVPRINVPNHPSALLHMDRYVYVENKDYPTRLLHGIIARNGYEEPIIQILYWQNRDTGERFYIDSNRELNRSPVSFLDSDGLARPRILNDHFKQPIFAANSVIEFPEFLPNSTGRYMWVLELRDATARHVLDRSYAMYSVVDEIVTISGDVMTDQQWTNDKAWVLDGRVNVRPGVTLTVSPGTFVFGGTDELSLLNVRVGARIIADGNPLFPVVFTSELPLFERSRSDWGGLIINGDAPVNEPNAFGEGDTGLYGGDNVEHDGGVLRYVRVEFSGRRFSPTDELNGLTLQGCGNKTILDHVQVHQSSDDGIEFFGGTVNGRYILVTGCGDDSLDWTYGYRGSLQHLVLMQLYGEADHGIEAENHPEIPLAQPRSLPTVSNASFLGFAALDPARAQPSNAIHLKNGAGGIIQNSLFFGFGGSAIYADSKVTSASFSKDESRVLDCVFFYNNRVASIADYDFEVIKDFSEPSFNNRFGVGDIRFVVLNTIKPNMTPRFEGNSIFSPAAEKTPDANPFIEKTGYIGGIDPDTSEPWIFAPWTAFPIR